MKIPAQLFLLMALFAPGGMLAQRRLVVVNVESRVPVRDVLVTTDSGQESRTTWDGLFTLPDSCHRIDFRHPGFEHRYVLKPEIQGDTIFLIPDIHALREVVILGERRFDKRMAQMLKPSPQHEKDIQLAQSVPAGFNPIAFALWVYNLSFKKKVDARTHRKKALKEVRRQEAEYQQMWNSLQSGK